MPIGKRMIDPWIFTDHHVGDETRSHHSAALPPPDRWVASGLRFGEQQNLRMSSPRR
jgi:hypothetical protein